jgi:putative intracellular protease/amidase
MANILVLLPGWDFAPTEAAVPWEAIVAAGHEVRFATPDGRPAPVTTARDSSACAATACARRCRWPA